MTYYAAITGNDIQSRREKLTATTLTGAKRQAWERFRSGFAHHTIYVGELLDEGTRNERGRPLAWRDVTGSKWHAETES